MFTANMTYHNTVTMITVECCTCGVVFGMPSELQDRFKKDPDKWFYCPSGHQQHYSKSTESKLREELEQEKRWRENDRLFLNNRITEVENSKKKLEKIVKRVHNGVCPCCNRTFQNLANHIQSKHPELVKAKRKIKDLSKK